MDNHNNTFASSSSNSTTGSKAIKAAMITGSGETMDAGFFNRILPVGYMFAPSDEELIDYLNMKLSGERLPTDQIIAVDLYTYDPQELTGAYELYREKEWYFFTPREKKYPNGVRPSRGTTDGYWKLTGTETHIKRNGRNIGVRAGLDFYKGKRTAGKRTDWKMHEYTPVKPTDDHCSNKVVAANSGMQLDKWVLCKIYKNTRSTKKSGDHEAQEELGEIPSEEVNEDDGPLDNNQHGSEGGQIQQITDEMPNPALQSYNNDFEYIYQYQYDPEIMALCSTETAPNFDMGMSPMDQTTCLDYQPCLFNEAVPNYDTGLSPVLEYPSMNQLPSSSSPIMFQDNNFATNSDFFDQSDTAMEYDQGHSNVHHLYPNI